MALRGAIPKNSLSFLFRESFCGFDGFLNNVDGISSYRSKKTGCALVEEIVFHTLKRCGTGYAAKHLIAAAINLEIDKARATNAPLRSIFSTLLGMACSSTMSVMQRCRSERLCLRR